MARGARIVLENHPHHVVQRGRNREVVFATDADFQFYVNRLREWKRRLECEIHAYCLMTNHVHLVVNPGDDPTRLGMLIKNVAGAYTMYLNQIEDRSGTVWDGRFKSSPMDTDEYYFEGCRYVELNPTRAGICVRPEEYRWSSYPAKIGLCACDWIDVDASYLGLGRTPEQRQEAYRDWIMAAVRRDRWDSIRDATARGRPIGSAEFVRRVERRIGRRLEVRSRGRPKLRGPDG